MRPGIRLKYLVKWFCPWGAYSPLSCQCNIQSNLVTLTTAQISKCKLLEQIQNQSQLVHQGRLPGGGGLYVGCGGETQHME